MGGQIKRNRNALSTRRKGFAIKRIGFFRSGKASVLTNGPRPDRIHRGLWPTHKRCKTRKGVGMWQCLYVFCGVERFDRDAIGRDPVQGI